MKRAIALLLAWVPLTASAFGDSGWVSLSGTDIQIIADQSGPRAFVYVTVNGSGCTGTIPELVWDTTLHVLSNSMYATLLAAKATGQQVDIETSDCSASGNPMIISVHTQ